ncbi:hypothetical protein A2246_04270 [candidate division WOR-1 bacterium RIFOXYA2_FULL_37_7]|nr:MAG: hypothetical protein A2246_04270 [candidate division WOR-1 bacterium RIFOXYA2_FULL_37_7]
MAEEIVLKLSKNFPIILLTEPRQVGKTTLFEHLSEKQSHAYVSLDEFEFRSLAKSDPSLFLEKYPPPIIIDKIQYAPQLLPYIKTYIDRDPRDLVRVGSLSSFEKFLILSQVCFNYLDI